MFTYGKSSAPSGLAWRTVIAAVSHFGMPIYRDVISKTLFTYIELVMSLREEWKSSPIRVDPQAVTIVEV